MWMSASMSQLRSNSSASALLNGSFETRFSWFRAVREGHSEQALEPRSHHALPLG
jgi:hypothetical protein